MDTIAEKLLSRKFLLAMFTVAISATLTSFKYLDGQMFVTIALSAMGTYTVGNVWQAVSLKQQG